MVHKDEKTCMIDEYLWKWTNINSLQEYLLTFWLLICMVSLLPLHLTPHLLPSSYPACYNWLVPDLLQINWFHSSHLAPRLVLLLTGTFYLVPCWLFIYCCTHGLVLFNLSHIITSNTLFDWFLTFCCVLVPLLLSLIGSCFLVTYWRLICCNCTE